MNKHCIICGSSFLARGPKITCSKKCSDVRRNERLRNLRTKHARYEPCAICGNTFRATRSSKTCSKKCSFEMERKMQRERCSNWRMLNKRKVKEYNKAYRTINKHRQREYERARYKSVENLREYRKHYLRAWKQKQSKISPRFRILRALSLRVYHLIKSAGFRKSKSSAKLIGCNWDTLKQHLEVQFKVGMNWNNYGSVWQIDHIIPCAAFNLTSPDSQAKCFKYTNLKPEFSKDNLLKSDFMPSGKRARNLAAKF